MTEPTADQTAREITITRMIDAPRELVFRAFTDAEELANWWGPEGFGVSSAESDPRPGGTFAIVMRGPDGVEYPMRGTYREVDSPGRLVADSEAIDADGRTLLEATTTLTLVDHGGKTEITLHARAVALAPEAIPMLGGMQAGWSQSLRCLEDVLTGTLDRQIVLTRMLHAPRERVFQAFTTRDEVEQWWGPDGFSVTIEQMDVRPGGLWKFTMHGPDGTDYPNEITYEELSPPELIVYVHGSSPESGDPVFRATVAFDEMMGSTIVTMKTVFESAEAREMGVSKYHVIEGGNQTLGRLEAYLAGANV
jgi:uncharacterized protein YndB with AHSA1/START domain